MRDLTILVADGEKSVCTFFRSAFEKEGYDVLAAQTVDDAIRMLRLRPFDAVFSDISMGNGDDGIALLQTAKTLQPDTPVILVASRPDAETAALAVRLKVHDYLTKPLSRRVVVQTARNAVETKKMQEEKRKAEEHDRAYRRTLEKTMIERTLELKRSRERYRSLFAASRDAVFVVSADGRLIDINRACMDILGYENMELKRMHFRDFFISPGLGTAVFRMVKKRGFIHDHEVKLATAEGGLRNCILSVKTLETSNRKLFEYQVIVRDITAQREAEASARQSRTMLLLLRAAIEQFSDSVIITDDRGVCLYANPASQPHSRPEDRLPGQKPFLMKPGDLHGGDYDKMWETIRSGRRWEKNYVLSDPGGALHEQEAVVFPVFDELGKIGNFVIIEKDVTEKRKLETAAEAANLMKNIGFIFSGLRHEIGNPVNSLLTTLTVLERKIDNLPSETVKKFIRGSLNEIDRVRFLLKALKNFNLFEYPRPCDIDLNRFVMDFRDLVDEDFSRKGIVIETVLSARVKGAFLDPRAFHQVLLNLMTNAADALEEREGKRIVMRTRKSADGVLVEIRDNGRGMSEDDRARLFTPFFTTKPHGTGLGLVIVKKLLLKMNCVIEIETRENRGTLVTILAPERPGS